MNNSKNNKNSSVSKVGKINSVKLIKTNYRKCTAKKSDHKNSKFRMKVFHNLQLQSKVMNLIFL